MSGDGLGQHEVGDGRPSDARHGSQRIGTDTIAPGVRPVRHQRQTHHNPLEVRSHKLVELRLLGRHDVAGHQADHPVGDAVEGGLAVAGSVHGGSGHVHDAADALGTHRLDDRPHAVAQRGHLAHFVAVRPQSADHRVRTPDRLRHRRGIAGHPCHDADPIGQRLDVVRVRDEQGHVMALRQRQVNDEAADPARTTEHRDSFARRPASAGATGDDSRPVVETLSKSTT